jgi:serine/threonine protein kinase
MDRTAEPYCRFKARFGRSRIISVIFGYGMDLCSDARVTMNPTSAVQPPSAVASDGARPARPSWQLSEGDEIALGRAALKSLGGGSLYEVYLVWDERLHAICVAKVVRPDQVTDLHAVRELEAESAILERLAHPVLVRGFDAVLDGEYPHLLLEHLEGPSLRRLIKRGGPLPLQQLLPLALSLAGALHYMAGEGIVHLDVKPDNIIMGVPPRLIDLSIARSVERARRVGKPLGTDAYMAPEQCEAARLASLIGPPSDVWGLGATLHHALSGSRPFPRDKADRESDDPHVRFPQLAAPPEPLPARIPAPLRALVTSMLDPDPAARPTASEVAAALEPLVADLPSKLTLSRRGARVW